MFDGDHSLNRSLLQSGIGIGQSVHDIILHHIVAPPTDLTLAVFVCKGVGHEDGRGMMMVF